MGAARWSVGGSIAHRGPRGRAPASEGMLSKMGFLPQIPALPRSPPMTGVTPRRNLRCQGLSRSPRASCLETPGWGPASESAHPGNGLAISSVNKPSDDADARPAWGLQGRCLLHLSFLPGTSLEEAPPKPVTRGQLQGKKGLPGGPRGDCPSHRKPPAAVPRSVRGCQMPVSTG